MRVRSALRELAAREQAGSVVLVPFAACVLERPRRGRSAAPPRLLVQPVVRLTSGAALEWALWLAPAGHPGRVARLGVDGTPRDAEPYQAGSWEHPRSVPGWFARAARLYLGQLGELVAAQPGLRLDREAS